MIGAFESMFVSDSLRGVVRVALVVGGGLLGFVLVVVGQTARSWFSARPANRSRGPMRLLGVVSGAFVAALIPLAVGTGGFGGFDWGLGGGPGSGPGVAKVTDHPAEKDAPAIKEHGDPISSPTSELRIEVLGNEPIRAFAKSSKADLNRCYRVDGENPPKLRSLGEIKGILDKRLTQKPALKRIDILVYADSPRPGDVRVDKLETALRDLSAVQKDQAFEVAVQDLKRDAPER